MKLNFSNKVLIMILVVVLGLVILGAWGEDFVWQYGKEPRACFRRKCVALEIAQTQHERSLGLQRRASLSDKEGMLFLFESPDRYTFWMKDTWIPLDMIWLDAGDRVVDIRRCVPPCRTPQCPTYQPEAEALSVLEIRSGLSEEWGLRKGDHLDIKIP